MTELANRVARQNLGADDLSEPPVLAFGMRTAKLLDGLKVEAEVHGVLRHISESYKESDWVYALCTVEGIGIKNSAAVAAAMREDIVSKLNSGGKGKGREI